MRMTAPARGRPAPLRRLGRLSAAAIEFTPARVLPLPHKTTPPCLIGQIKVRSARTHKLKNLCRDLPRDRLTVITGLSGFDTLFAKGECRDVVSHSARARRVVQLMAEPKVDLIRGLSPATSIKGKATSHVRPWASPPRSMTSCPSSMPAPTRGTAP